MSIAFTPVEDWANQTQDLIGFNELVLAYSERRQTLGQSAVDPLTAGVSGFDKTLCLAMQEWCEANCTSFIDHVSGPFNAGSTDFLYFTLATWRAAAGLHADGFRRRVEPGDADSYGTIEVGDARGDWCFEDLQRGFSALRWVVRLGTAGEGLQQNGYYKAPVADMTLAEQKAICEANYTGDSPVFYAGELEIYSTIREWAHFYIGARRVTLYELALTAVSTEMIMQNIPTIVPHAWSLYFLTTIRPYTPYNNNLEFDTLGQFTAEKDKWSEVNSGGDSSSSSHTLSYGSLGMPTWGTTPSYPPNDVTRRGFAVDSFMFVLKWNFTNQG